MFFDGFYRMILEIKKLKKIIILMYFQIKNIFKNYFILQYQTSTKNTILNTYFFIKKIRVLT
jgi:hypothetical protein